MGVSRQRVTTLEATYRVPRDAASRYLTALRAPVLKDTLDENATTRAS